MNLMSLTAVELGKKIKSGEVRVVDAVNAAFDQIEAVEKDINSYVTVYKKEEVLEKAEHIQKLIDEGQLTGPLAGVPVAIKDNMCTRDKLTTCSSKILGNFYPTYSAEAVINLEKAGAVIIGKTNMDEFAMGSTTETSFYGPTKNPWNKEHVPGGSSGGSCAAVAAEECSYALGSDTGGSIRQPSSFCGVTGIKPTYGTVSRYGLIAYGSSLDQIGPVAKDVTDCATILETIASYDSKDSTSVKRDDYNFTEALVEDVKGLKIGIPNGLENGMFQMGKILVQRLVSTFGTAAIAAHAVAFSLTSIAVVPGMALGLAILTVVGQCIGANDYQQAKYYTKKLMIIAYLSTIVAAGILLVGVRYILRFYALPQDTANLAVSMVSLHCVFDFFVWPMAFSFPNALRAANDATFTMIVSTFSMWTFRFALSYVFALYLRMGVIGVWWAMIVDWIFRSICFMIRYKSNKWMNRTLV